jgi:hypothetical protein
MATEIESNGLVSQASTKPSFDASVTHTGSLQSTSDIDLFKISPDSIPTASIITVSFDSPLTNSFTDAYTVTAVNEDGTSLATALVTGGDGTLQIASAPAGQAVYLKVSATSGSTEAVGETYAFSYSVRPVEENRNDSSSESNGTFLAADALVPGQNFYGNLDRETDVDRFSFTSGTSGNVTLDFTAYTTSQTENYFDIRVIDGSNGQTVTYLGEAMSGTTSTTLDQRLFEITGEAQKQYYVEVKFNSEATWDTGIRTQDYTLRVGGTTDFNVAPVVQVGDQVSDVNYDGVRDTGITSAVGVESQTLLSDLISVTDGNTSDGVSRYYVGLTSVSDSTTEDPDDVDNGGSITYRSGGATQTISPLTDANGAFTELTATEFATAKYVGGTEGGTQSLKVYVIDDSVSSGYYLDDFTGNADGIPSDQSGVSGALSFVIQTSDASVSSAFASGSDSSVVEGASDGTEISSITITLDEGSNDSRTEDVIVAFSNDDQVQVIQTDGSGNYLDDDGAIVTDSADAAVLSAVTFAEDEVTKTVTVRATTDTVPEGTHTGSLGFTVTSSNAAFDGLVMAPVEFNLTENLPSFTVSAVSFIGSTGETLSGVSGLSEALALGSSSVRAKYTITLDRAPSENLTVTLSYSSDIAPDNETLSFAADGTYPLAQDVTISVVNDTEADEGTETAQVSHLVTKTATETAAYGYDVDTVSITVIDNDSTPAIEEGQTFLVSSEAADDAIIGFIDSSDADGDSLNFSLIELNESGVSKESNEYFLINSSTGQIQVKTGALLTNAIAADADTGEVSVVVTASDGTLSDSQTVVITVDSTITPAPPEINAKTVSGVSESAAAGTVVATITGTDANSDALTHTIQSGNTGDVFTIDPTTGAVSIAPGKSLDYESVDQYRLTVRAAETDNSENHDEAVLTINLSDVNDNSPVLTLAETASIARDASVNSVVASASATDADQDSDLSFSISAGNSAGYFDITDSGSIVLAQNLPATNIDPDIVLTVAVSDGVNTTTGDITISDVEAGVNLAPTITSPGNLAVEENANPQARPFTLDDDSDSMADLIGSLTYSSSNTELLPLNNIIISELNSTTAQIKVTPVAGQTGSSTITVVATDLGDDGEGANALSSEMSFNVVVGSGSTGLVQFWNEYDGGDAPVAPAISGVEFTLADSDGTEIGTFLTAENGTADLTDLMGGPYSISGSVANTGGIVTVSDIVSAIQLYLKAPNEVSEYGQIAADLNQDGNVGVSDIVDMISLYLGTPGVDLGLVLVDDSGDAPSAEVSIGGGNVELTAIAMGDLDGSWATASVLPDIS